MRGRSVVRVGPEIAALRARILVLSRTEAAQTPRSVQASMSTWLAPTRNEARPNQNKFTGGFLGYAGQVLTGREVRCRRPAARTAPAPLTPLFLMRAR